LTASYINTKDNTIADKASRLKVDSNDFQIDNIAFRRITSALGDPEIDFFASYNTHKCERYYSWFPDPNSSGVDAFVQDWSNHFFYAFPPFALINRVLCKILSEGSTGILIVPKWKSQSWYPTFLKLTRSEVVSLEKGTFQLINPSDNRPHPLCGSLNLMAAVVSGAKMK